MKRILRALLRGSLWGLVVVGVVLSLGMFAAFCIYRHAGALVAMVSSGAMAFMAYQCLGAEQDLKDLS